MKSRKGFVSCPLKRVWRLRRAMNRTSPSSNAFGDMVRKNPWCAGVKNGTWTSEHQVKGGKASDTPDTNDEAKDVCNAEDELSGEEAKHLGKTDVPHHGRPTSAVRYRHGNGRRVGNMARLIRAAL